MTLTQKQRIEYLRGLGESGSHSTRTVALGFRTGGSNCSGVLKTSLQSGIYRLESSFFIVLLPILQKTGFASSRPKDSSRTKDVSQPQAAFTFLNGAESTVY